MDCCRFCTTDADQAMRAGIMEFGGVQEDEEEVMDSDGDCFHCISLAQMFG